MSSIKFKFKIFHNIAMKTYNEIYNRIAIKMKMLRFERKLTQETLSEISGISINSISNIENMKEDIKLSTLISIAKALNMDIKEFL